MNQRDVPLKAPNGIDPDPFVMSFTDFRKLLGIPIDPLDCEKHFFKLHSSAEGGVIQWKCLWCKDSHIKSRQDFHDELINVTA